MCDNLLVLHLELVAHSLSLRRIALIADYQCVITVLVMLLPFIRSTTSWFILRLILIGALQQLETVADLRSVKAI